MKAAEQEDDVAQYNIGLYLEQGRCDAKDLVQALFWYRKAAAQGYQHAITAVERLLL